MAEAAGRLGAVVCVCGLPGLVRRAALEAVGPAEPASEAPRVRLPLAVVRREAQE